MSDSMWKSYLDPQIEARNRWAVRRYASVEDLPDRPRAERPVALRIGSGARTRVTAAATMLGALLLAVIVVLALRIASPAREDVLAPAGSAVAGVHVAGVHVGGTPAAPGYAPAGLGRAVAQ
jgi:hypothetical protein